MRKTILVVAAIACAIPAIAFAAADPRPNSHFSYQKGDRIPLDFNTNKDGDKITHLNIYSKCAPVPVGKKGFFPNMAVNNGKFHKEGSIDDVIGMKIKYSIEGKFTTPTKAEGTYNVDSPERNCKDRDRSFVAKRDGKAQRGF